MHLSPATLAALLATLVVGTLVALQPPINSELGRRTSDLAAAFISSGVTFFVLTAILLLFGDLGSVARVREVPLGYLLGGLAGVAFVGASLVIVRQLGAAGFLAALVASQLIVAAILDQFGVLGLEKTPLTAVRALGIAALLLGMVLLTIKQPS